MIKGLKEILDNDEFTLPDDTPVNCYECNWEGKLCECGVEMDSEGWEYPEYEVLVCPNCGEYNIEV